MSTPDAWQLTDKIIWSAIITPFSFIPIHTLTSWILGSWNPCSLVGNLYHNPERYAYNGVPATYTRRFIPHFFWVIIVAIIMCVRRWRCRINLCHIVWWWGYENNHKRTLFPLQYLHCQTSTVWGFFWHWWKTWLGHVFFAGTESYFNLSSYSFYMTRNGYHNIKPIHAIDRHDEVVGKLTCDMLFYFLHIFFQFLIWQRNQYS